MGDEEVAALERRLGEALARGAAEAAEVAALRAELARVRAHEAGVVGDWPRAWRLLLAYQLPVVILAICLMPVPIALVLLVPVPVVLLIAGVVGLVLERRAARRIEAPSLGVALARHQICAGVPLQVYVVMVAYHLATFRLFHGPTAMRWDDFAIGLAIGEGLYALGVFWPLAWIARKAHAQHKRRWLLGPGAT